MNWFIVYIVLILFCIGAISGGAFLVSQQKLFGLLLIILGVVLLLYFIKELTRKP
jgi:uncharacterized membrane protein YoaK (UPF0700 family)